MPKKPMKPCKYPGCKALTDGSYCLEHSRLLYSRYNKTQRDETRSRSYDEEWRAIREQYVVFRPFCEICKKHGKLVRVEEVHHIKPLAEGGTHDFKNLISLCHRCHAKIHAERGDYLNNKKKVYSY